MLERRALLAGQDQAARLGARQRSFPAFLIDAMPLALRHQFRCALQPLFGLDHVAT
jgi:hypothetical protein